MYDLSIRLNPHNLVTSSQRLCVCLFQVYLKAHFSYDPKRDNLVPSRDAALAFKEGDILQVLNMDDPNWWQVPKTKTKQISYKWFY